MPPVSANPKFQRLLTEIDNFYFTKELEGFEILNYKDVKTAKEASRTVDASTAHGLFCDLMMKCSNYGIMGEKMPLSINLYVNRMEKALDDWIKGNNYYITNIKQLENAYKAFEETDAWKNIKAEIFNSPSLLAEEKETIINAKLFDADEEGQLAWPIALSFQSKVMVHQQRVLLQKLKDNAFDRGTRENPSDDRKALEYGFVLLFDRPGSTSLGQNNCTSWGLLAEEIGNPVDNEQNFKFARKLTSLFLDGDEELEDNMDKKDQLFVEVIKQYNSGSESGFLTKSAATAAKLNEKYIGIKRSGIKKVGGASLAWCTRREATNAWKKESQQTAEELNKLNGTFSPFKKLFLSIEKAYYDRKGANALKEEKRAATIFEKRYINNDSEVLLAKQKFEKFCSDKEIGFGKNGKLNKEDLGKFSRLLFNVSKASYDAKITLGLNKDTIENSQNLWNKTNESISQMVLQNAANCQTAHEINAGRYLETKTLIENRFTTMETQERPIEFRVIGPTQNTVDETIVEQTSEVPAQNTAPAPSQTSAPAQALQPVIEVNTNN